jgi:peptide chain release factor subunit 1
MVNDVTPERLRRLAEPREDVAVLSLYLDLDPSRVPTPPARESAVDSVLADARRAVEDRELGHDARAALREALGELERRLRPSAGMQADGARGLAAFAGVDGSDEIELLRLPAPVPTQVAVDRGAHVEPLIAMVAPDRWCVALVNRQTARFHLGDEWALEQTGALDDDVHGRHQQGGWSQRNYEGSIEEEVAHHLDRVARALHVAHVQRGLFGRLLVGAPKELRGALEAALHPDTRAVLAGWVDVDQSAAGADAVRQAAAAAIAAHRAARRRAALDRLQAGVGSDGGHGVHGLPGVLQALHERRVEVLLLHEGVHRPGGRCPRCGLVSLDAGAPCPADGSALEPVADAVEAGIALAYQQDAEVLVLSEEPRLQTLGGAGAVLRF